MIVTAWSNGRVGYGIKIKKKDRDRFFKRSWKSVILQFENSPNQAKVNVAKKSFWNLECRELIKKEIGDWLQNNGLVAQWLSAGIMVGAFRQQSFHAPQTNAK